MGSKSGKHYSAASPNDLNQAMALHQQGKFTDAEALYKNCLQKNPNNANAVHYYGLLLLQTGQTNQAREYLNRSVELAPDDADFLSNYGSYLIQSEKFTEALPILEKSLNLNDKNPNTHHNLGLALAKTGKLHEAFQAEMKALQLNPGFLDAMVAVASLKMQAGDLQEATHILQKLYENNTNYFDVVYNLALCYAELGGGPDALKLFQKAQQLRPTHNQVYTFLGELYLKAEQPAEAKKILEQGLKLNKDFATSNQALFRVHRNLCYWDTWDQELTKLDQILDEQLSSHSRITEYPMTHYVRSMDKSRILKHMQSYSNDLNNRMAVVKNNLVFNYDWPKHEKIRIGYVSANFKNHPNMQLLEDAFSYHDRNKFEVYAFSHGVADKSDYRELVQKSVDHFIDIYPLSHEQAAKLIHQHQIDILINLNGYTEGNRMDIMALRPAPVQVVYLGYPNTTGADFIDYMITDKVVTPPEHKTFYSEKFAYLPDAYQMNNRRQKIDAAIPTRQDVGLPTDGFVFCCFNSIYKLEPHVFKVWMTILKEVPGSVLWLLSSYEETMSNLKKEAAKHGVAANRLVFSKNLPKASHLARIQLADLFLDSFICNAHVTTSDTVWGGVPVLTLLGDHFCSRVSSSLVSALGLPELITTSVEDYTAKAIEIGKSPNQVIDLKKKIAQLRITGPLFDTQKTVGYLDKLYEKMHTSRHQGALPDILSA